MDVNRGNVFSAVALSAFMTDSLSKDSSPHLKTPYDALALLSHTCMVAVGFRLVGLGEDHKIPAEADRHAAQPLPSEWNASSSNYAFRYAHSQSSMEYLIQVSRLGSKVIINGLAVGDEKVHSLDLPVNDFVPESSFPYTLPSQTDNEENAESIRHLFISAGRMTDAGSLLKLQIIQKLAPGLHKEGYEDSAHAASQNADERDSRDSLTPRPGNAQRDPPPRDPLRDDRQPPAQPHPFQDPLAAESRRHFPQGDFPPPGFEDEYDITRPPGRGGIGEGRPLNIGERDLYPPGLGPNDPFRGGGGLGPGGGGGMHPTLDDPLFGGRGGNGRMDPRAPPGARYDPLGPGDGPPHGRGGRFPGGGAGGLGGAPPNPFGGYGSGDFI